MKWDVRIFATLAFLTASSSPAATLVESGTFGGMRVDYKVALPDSFDPARAYPTILAFGGGPQTMPMVDSGLNRYWGGEARRRGYIVVSPAAPEGQLFFENGARIFPEFLDMVLRDYKVQGGRMHIGGFSNGGISAFHIASLYPKYFWSVTGLPGFLLDAADTKIAALQPMCLYMLVGGGDPWRGVMREQAEVFRQKGYAVQFRVEEDQDHFLSLGPEGAARLFDHLDAAAKGCGK